VRSERPDIVISADCFLAQSLFSATGESSEILESRVSEELLSGKYGKSVVLYVERGWKGDDWKETISLVENVRKGSDEVSSELIGTPKTGEAIILRRR